MEYKRADRVGDQIQREVSRMLHEEIKDPRIGMVTISRVQVSSDLRYAKIYYTVYGDEAQQRDSAEGLNKAASFIRRQLGQYLRLRVVPEVSFHFDSSLEHVARISSLLHQIEQQNAAQNPPPEPAPKPRRSRKAKAEPAGSSEAKEDAEGEAPGDSDAP
jgi:ribosome-binding factor A